LLPLFAVVLPALLIAPPEDLEAEVTFNAVTALEVITG
jgi:hypothetical protein